MLELEGIIRDDIPGLRRYSRQALQQLEARLEGETRNEANTVSESARAAEALEAKQKERESVPGPHRAGPIGNEEVWQRPRESQRETETLKTGQVCPFGEREALTRPRASTTDAGTPRESLGKVRCSIGDAPKRDLMEALVGKTVVDTEAERPGRRSEITSHFRCDKPPPDVSGGCPDCHRRDFPRHFPPEGGDRALGTYGMRSPAPRHPAGDATIVSSQDRGTMSSSLLLPATDSAAGADRSA